jgi:hypothetical protein
MSKLGRDKCLTSIPPKGILILKTRSFHQWANKIRLRDKSLKKAIAEIDQGLYDARLGGNLYKKRIATNGKGKRGGFRTIIAFKKEDKAFFIYGYAKNVCANIGEKERQTMLKLAKIYFSYNSIQITEAINVKKFIEVL